MVEVVGWRGSHTSPSWVRPACEISVEFDTLSSSRSMLLSLALTLERVSRRVGLRDALEDWSTRILWLMDLFLGSAFIRGEEI